MKKLIPVLLYIIFAGSYVFAKPCECAYREFIFFEQRRAAVLSALNLNDEQQACLEEFYRKNASYYQNKLCELEKEIKKLILLENSCACHEDICVQKNIVEALKSDINKYIKEENKEFKKILNHSQRSKFSMMQKLAKNDWKKELYPKDYYKKNPQMQKFGNEYANCPQK